MNLDGCRNCKHVEFTGMCKIMRCSLDSEMVHSDDKCSNWKLDKESQKRGLANGGKK